MEVVFKPSELKHCDSMRFIFCLLLCASSTLLSACGWNWSDKGSLLPQYEFETTLELSRNNEFVDLVGELARSNGFEDPIVRQFPVFGTTEIDVKNGVFLIIFSNSAERMEHRTDALCKIADCEIADDTDFTTYSAFFYCNWVDCDLEQLRLAAEKFRSSIEMKYKVTKLVKREHHAPAQMP